MKEPKEIELRSEKIRIIISKMPPLLLRIGISVIAYVLLLIFGLLYFIPYPQTVGFPVKIYSENNDSVYYAKARLSLSEARLIRLEQKGIISIQCLQGDYELKGQIHYIKENKGKVDLHITLANTEKHINHLRILPEGMATIYVSRSSLLKRQIPF